MVLSFKNEEIPEEVASQESQSGSSQSLSSAENSKNDRELISLNYH